MSEFQSERFQDLAPQQTGLIHEQDKVRASEDIRTIQLTNRDGSMAVITPVENNSELNQLYFDSSDAYYVSSIIELDTDSLHTVAEFIRDSPSKRKIVLEYSQLRSGKSPEMLMSDLSNLSGRQLEIDQNAIDAFNNTIAGVTHFYSPVNRNHEPALPAGSMIEAFDVVVANGVWNEVQKRGVEYINGPDITDDVLSDLWDVYNDTFDVLVDNHPSAQKQLKADFLAQCIKPNSHITYVKDKDEIVSALFLIDDARECNWLSPAYFENVNPYGSTVFVPCISTRIDKKGLSYSPKTMSAMSLIAQEAGTITGFATQCTNRSVDYIPDIAQRATNGIVNLQFECTDDIKYPVIVIK